MTPERYLECLELISLEHGLERSRLLPVMSIDLMAVERELNMTLPQQYVSFVEKIGCGEEFGGVSLWLHFDISMPGNVIDRSRALARQVQDAPRRGRGAKRLPRGFFAFYDSCEGDIYGFVPVSAGTFSPEVYAWNTEVGELSRVTDSFDKFLDYLVEDYVELDDDLL